MKSRGEVKVIRVVMVDKVEESQHSRLVQNFVVNWEPAVTNVERSVTTRKTAVALRTPKPLHQPPKHHADKAAETGDEADSQGSLMFVAHEVLTAGIEKHDWIIDSGASRHMTFRSDVLRRYKEFEKPEQFGLGDGRTVEALGTGDIKFISHLPHNRRVIGWMSNVLYVPQLATNLFSVHAATLQGNTVSFGRQCWIRNKRNELVGTGAPAGKLYTLNGEVMKSSDDTVAAVAEDQGSITRLDLWHQRLAHVNVRQLRQLTANADGIDIPLQGTQSFCEACVQGKMHQLSHPPSKGIKSTKKLQLVYTDICGPMQTESFGKVDTSLRSLTTIHATVQPTS